jgi:hypothetical protein
VIIFSIFKSDFSLFLELGQLVKVLEDQVLDALLVDLDFDLVLFTQVLELSLFVAELCLLILELLFANDPEVVNSLTLILIEASQILFLSDFLFKSSVLNTKGLLIVFVIYVIDGFSLSTSFSLKSACLLGSSILFRGHD